MGSNVQHQWILEFLLRQPVEDHDLFPLFSALYLSVNDHRLAKTLLLRRISSVVNKFLISEEILESLEIIKELDHLDGTRVSDSMKEAYCTVARSCMVKFLKENPEYNEAIDRIWKGRMLAMEKGEVEHIISDWSNDLRTEFEEAIRNINVLSSVSVEDTEKIALQAVGLFLKKTTEQMGPPFLEVAAKAFSEEGDGIQPLISTVVTNQFGEREEGQICHFDTVGDENMSESTSSEMDLDHHPVDISEVRTKKCNPVSSPEVRRVQEALKSSVLELHEAVKDPLPDALRMAETVAASLAREVVSNLHSSENQDGMDRCDHSKDHENDKDREGNAGTSAGVSRPSLLERNNTARTYEWDEDELESSTEGSRSHLHLPSPQSIKHSPLRKQVIRNTTGAGRRRKKKWSTLEESTLIDAVRECGRGNWKLILNTYREIFDDRTEIDLKDKWRNLNK